MDIAKIRKKAREKELEAGRKQKETDEVPEAPPQEEHEPAAEASVDAGDMEESTGENQEEEVPLSPEVPDAVTPETESEDEREETGVSQPEEAVNVLELLTFTIAEKEFAFRIDDVEEIIPYQGITFVPLLPVYVSGIMSLRGKIIPVIDLKARFGLGRNTLDASSPDSSGPQTGKEKILILAGSSGLIGATVDGISGVVRFPADSVLEPPAHLTEEERRFIDGVVIREKRFISIIRFGDAMEIDLG